MKIISYVQNYLGALKFGTSRRSGGIDILASASSGYYKSKSKPRNFWDKACFLLIDDSWDHNSDSGLFDESIQLKNEIIPFFKKDIIGEYAFINRNKNKEERMMYVKFPSWPPVNQIEVEKLNDRFKYILYKLEKGYFANGFLNKEFKLMTVMIIVSEIDWSLIENIPENLLLIYNDKAKQINFPESNNRIKASFQELRGSNSNNENI